jgi:hypothetical protein
MINHRSMPQHIETVEQLASAISDLMAQVYVNTWSELSKRPSVPASEQLLDKLFGTMADLDEIAKKSGGRGVRRLLGDSSRRVVH